MRKFAIASAFFVFLFGQASQPIFSQSSTSVVEGIVQDATGAVIQDCDVVLMNTDTGGKLTTHTNTEGVYAFSLFSPACIRWRPPRRDSSPIRWTTSESQSPNVQRKMSSWDLAPHPQP